MYFKERTIIIFVFTLINPNLGQQVLFCFLFIFILNPLLLEQSAGCQSERVFLWLVLLETVYSWKSWVPYGKHLALWDVSIQKIDIKNVGVFAQAISCNTVDQVLVKGNKLRYTVVNYVDINASAVVLVESFFLGRLVLTWTWPHNIT